MSIANRYRPQLSWFTVLHPDRKWRETLMRFLQKELPVTQIAILC